MRDFPSLDWIRWCNYRFSAVRNQYLWIARPCFLVSTLTRLPTEECVTKSFRDNSFFQSYSKRVTGTNSFSQSSQRVMTEDFLKPNAKTAFFKAIFKFCTVNQLFKSLTMCVNYLTRNLPSQVSPTNSSEQLHDVKFRSRPTLKTQVPSLRQGLSRQGSAVKVIAM